MIDFLSRDLWKLQQEQQTVLTHHYSIWQQWEEAKRTDRWGGGFAPTWSRLKDLSRPKYTSPIFKVASKS